MIVSEEIKMIIMQKQEFTITVYTRKPDWFDKPYRNYFFEKEN